MQEDPETKKLHPLMYLSKSLSGSEIRYKATELECLAVHWALVDQRADILDGGKFELRTDHQALLALFAFKTKNPRLTKWALNLTPFRLDMTISHTPGKWNSVADAMSSLPGLSSRQKEASWVCGRLRNVRKLRSQSLVRRELPRAIRIEHMKVLKSINMSV